MEGIDKPHPGKYKEITNDSNYDASCTLSSLPVWDLENFKGLIFVVQSVQAPSLPAPQSPDGLRPVCIESLFILCTNRKAVIDTS
jgi:hypothetical protein